MISYLGIIAETLLLPTLSGTPRRGKVFSIKIRRDGGSIFKMIILKTTL
jgi:hypothetical protein